MDIRRCLALVENAEGDTDTCHLPWGHSGDHDPVNYDRAVQSRVVSWLWRGTESSPIGFPGQFFADLACGCRIAISHAKKASMREGDSLGCEGEANHRPRFE